MLPDNLQGTIKKLEKSGAGEMNCPSQHLLITTPGGQFRHPISPIDWPLREKHTGVRVLAREPLSGRKKTRICCTANCHWRVEFHAESQDEVENRHWCQVKTMWFQGMVHRLRVTVRKPADFFFQKGEVHLNIAWYYMCESGVSRGTTTSLHNVSLNSTPSTAYHYPGYL